MALGTFTALCMHHLYAVVRPFLPHKRKPHTQEAVTHLSPMCGPFASLADEPGNGELKEMIEHQRFSLWGIYLIQNAKITF